MQFTTQIILVLAATVSAVDVRIHDNSGCSGGAWTCFGINPNTCCSAPPSPQHRSVGFYGVFENWQFEARAYQGVDCQRQTNIQQVVGQNFVCLNGGTVGSGGYGFWGKKSKRSADNCTANTEEKKCLHSAAANGLVLADGTKYSIADVPEDVVSGLAEFVFNGTTAENVPKEYEQYKVTA